MATNKPNPTTKPKVDGGCTLWARQTIDSEIFTDKPDVWFKIWFYLVNKANHQDNQKFKRGQAYVKYDWIMSATGATNAQVHHCIRYLKSRHAVTTRKATRGMYITIVNYDTYQNLDSYRSHTENQPKDRQKTDRRHTINKNGNNDNKYSPTSIEARLSELLLSLILDRKTNFRLGQPDCRKKTIDRWAIHADRMIRLDKRTPEQVEAVIRWCQQDDFWQNNILSTEKLRRQFDQLELKMRQQNPVAPPRDMKRNAEGLTPIQAKLKERTLQDVGW